MSKAYGSGSQTVSRCSFGSRGFLPGDPRTITVYFTKFYLFS